MAMGGGVSVHIRLRQGFGGQACTPPVPQLEGVSLFKPLVMPAVGAEPGEREVHLPVELQFLGNDLESFGALFVAAH